MATNYDATALAMCWRGFTMRCKGMATVWNEAPSDCHAPGKRGRDPSGAPALIRREALFEEAFTMLAHLGGLLVYPLPVLVLESVAFGDGRQHYSRLFHRYPEWYVCFTHNV